MPTGKSLTPTKEELLNFVNVKLNHNSTRHADIGFLMSVRRPLEVNGILNVEREQRLLGLYREYKERNKRYNKTARDKRKAKLEEHKLKQEVNAHINGHGRE